MTPAPSQTQLPSTSPLPHDSEHVLHQQAALPSPISRTYDLQDSGAKSQLDSARDYSPQAPFVLDLAKSSYGEKRSTSTDSRDDTVLNVTADAGNGASQEVKGGLTPHVSSNPEHKAEGKVEVEVVEKGVEKWEDPLRNGVPAGLAQTQDLAVVVEEDVGDQLLDAHGRLLFTDSGTRSTPAGSRRASHLRIDIKPGSPQPWELIDPPSEEGRKAGPDFDSTIESHKYNVLQGPASAYYYGPPPPDSAYGTAPVGQIGLHHPREIVRIERDYSGGELIQFAPIYPLELEGRINPTQFLESINSINELLISAHSLRHAFIDNLIAVATLQLSRLFVSTHFDRELERLRGLIDELNAQTFNPNGLNILWPGNVAFLFVSAVYTWTQVLSSFIMLPLCWVNESTLA
ncbi:hypothetical protein AX16_000628 [Volvariella volvacea WC 439]|nr:hypothetical protein AX16_000628 [Volvariella volvacea WC 439]